MALIIEKITVKAITERVRINRNTFYLHYNCVDDVLAEIQAKHSTEYSAIVAKFDQLKDTDKLMRSFFEYMEAQDDFFKKVTCDSRFDYIRERMQNKVTKQMSQAQQFNGMDECVRNVLICFNNCVVYLYRQWVYDDRKIPLEKMIEPFSLRRFCTTLFEAYASVIILFLSGVKPNTSATLQFPKSSILFQKANLTYFLKYSFFYNRFFA